MAKLEGILSQYAFFKGMVAHHLQLIAKGASNVRFDADKYLFREGEEANRFYLITRGKIALELFAAERGRIVIETIGEGELLGWSWIIPPYENRFSARAVELTRAIAFDGSGIRATCEQDHELGYELLKRLARVIGQRLQATRLQLLDVYGMRRS